MHQEQEPAHRPGASLLAGNRIFLTVLLIAYALIWILAAVYSAFNPANDTTSTPNTLFSSIVSLLLIGDIIVVLALDWRGYTTLSGLITWRNVRGKARFWLIVACIFVFEIWLGIYLVRATYMAYRGIAPAPHQVPQQAPVSYHDYEDTPAPLYPHDSQQH